MTDQRIITIDITHLVTAALAGERRVATGAEPPLSPTDPLTHPAGGERPRRFASLPDTPAHS